MVDVISDEIEYAIREEINTVIVARYTLSQQGWARDGRRCLYLNEVDHPSIYLAGSNIDRDFYEVDEDSEGILLYTPSLDVPERFEFDCWWVTLKRIDENETDFIGDARYIELCLSTDSRCWYYLNWMCAGCPEEE
jgi:hypothetical protein